MRPFGYFVHHQGRGHATRCASLVNALPADRSVSVFCARDDIFPPLRKGVTVRRIPSLFEEPNAVPRAMSTLRSPPNVHCAPVGWPTIRQAMGTIARFFAEEDPALMISDVSCEVAQLARVASVPCVHVLQHGDRSDPGHMHAYEGCAGLLAPYDARLEQEGRPAWLLDLVHHAPGLGVASRVRGDRVRARLRLGLAPDANVVLVLSGGGGAGTPLAPLTMAARAMPDTLFVTIGTVAGEWHETGAANLRHDGWVDGADDHLDAADAVIASTGNTTCHQILARGLPWLAVPEWRYFEEQLWKGRCLAREGVCALRETWPGTPQGWRDALAEAARADGARARSMVRADAAPRAARWLEDLAARLWDRSEPALLAAE
ncbi:hypothetical protein BCF33_2619 [Hasllibacter halocynthiae]|uniref:Glycosyltransferase n=1 Tax=Hasllibacter halocynthiae TaxID=595589 RepID=A0A2T0X4A7_9RHOB|nr:hypothetical protein [Hasllibacter halocynthiae]PRY93735.1 hypothetical protein BCF33_2619 [Hasllibacter halocynthiae]